MIRALFFLFGLAAVAYGAATPVADADAPRMLLHLLSYVGSDYGGAVQNGKVLSKDEYQEQTEFSRTAREMAERVPQVRSNKQILVELDRLRELVAKKAAAGEVTAAAQAASRDVIAATGLVIAPAAWPDRAHGKALYEKSCQQCHGATGHGDGPASGSQNPPPFDFHSAKTDGVSPFQAFNAIRLGVPGTTMAPFAYLSDNDVWDLAFYVLSLRHEADAQNPRFAALAQTSPLTLEQVATQPDEALRKLLSGSEDEKTVLLSAMRLREPSVHNASTLRVAVTELKQAAAQAKEGQWDLATAASVRAYLDGVEPAEAELRSRDSSFMLELEQKMAEVRGAIQHRAPLESLQPKVSAALNALSQAEALLAQQAASPAFTFTIAAGIFLREAFEAVLIIITLLGIIRSVGAREAMLAVHAGWISALGIGLVVWFFSGWLIAISGAQREMLEAVTSLIAVLILLYFGFWLHQRTEIGKWHTFINEKVKTALEGKKLVGLAAISFMAVFREALETVIFLRALLIEAGPQQQVAMALGVLVSFVVVLALAALIIRFSVRLPLRQLFAACSLVMVLLSLILVGKAAHSFQETGLLSITSLPLSSLNVDLIGLYPTYETIVPQLVIVAGALVYWLYQRRYVVK